MVRQASNNPAQPRFLSEFVLRKLTACVKMAADALTSKAKLEKGFHRIYYAPFAASRIGF